MDGARLFYYPPEAAPYDTVIVICPGGGYRFLSPREAAPIAHAFAQMGYHAYVVEYTVNKPPLGLRPVQELAAALAQVEAAAQRYGYAPNKIVLCGFSAGAHLCATLGVYWNHTEIMSHAPSRKIRPAGMILAYPVITMGEFAHPGSCAMLTGGDSALAEILSLEKHVSRDTPPAFIWHTFTDEKVPVQNSLLFAQAMIQAGVPCEYHLYPHGKHGLSLATSETESLDEGLLADQHIATWLWQCAYWLEENVNNSQPVTFF